MKTIYFTIAIVTLINFTVINLANATDKPMNILMLTVDDMNCDSVGVFGCMIGGALLPLIV